MGDNLLFHLKQNLAAKYSDKKLELLSRFHGVPCLNRHDCIHAVALENARYGGYEIASANLPGKRKHGDDDSDAGDSDNDNGDDNDFDGYDFDNGDNGDDNDNDHLTNIGDNHEPGDLQGTFGPAFNVDARIRQNFELLRQDPQKWTCDKWDDDDNEIPSYLREKSKRLFIHVWSWKELAAIWSLFYTGDICTHYGASFLGDDANKLIDTTSAREFYDLCSFGLIPFDGQEGSVKQSQRAYIAFNVENDDIALLLHDELNKYYDVVATFSDSLQKDLYHRKPKRKVRIQWPIVTYDASQHGVPFLGAPDGIVMGETVGFTYASTEIGNIDILDDEGKQPHFLRHQVGVTIFDPDYRRNTLRQRLLEVLYKLWHAGKIEKYDLSEIRKKMWIRINS